MLGRIHSVSESLSLDKQIESMLDAYDEPYITQSEIEEGGTELIPYLTQLILEFCNEPQPAWTPAIS